MQYSDASRLTVAAQMGNGEAGFVEEFITFWKLEGDLPPTHHRG